VEENNVFSNTFSYYNKYYIIQQILYSHNGENILSIIEIRIFIKKIKLFLVFFYTHTHTHARARARARVVFGNIILFFFSSQL